MHILKKLFYSVDRSSEGVVDLVTDVQCLWLLFLPCVSKAL